MSQKSELPIIDAEFVDIPSSTPANVANSLARMPHVRRNKAKAKQSPIRKEKGPEGRIDTLAAGVLKVAYAKQTGMPPDPTISGTIDAAVYMLVGKNKRAKGPEWDFLKALLGK